MKRFMFVLLVVLVGNVMAADDAVEVQNCFKAINEFRSENRHLPVTWNDEIAEDCQVWADKLHRLGRIRYRTGLFRLQSAGIHGYSGENCACGNDSGYDTFVQWRTSTAGHREFMLRQDRTVGAVAKSGKFWVYRAEKDIETYRMKSKKKDNKN
jgi:uncharacterized protein YkwD